MAIVSSVIFLVAGAIGLESTVWLWRRYRDASPEIDPRNRLIFKVIVAVCVVIVVTAVWIGGLSIARLTLDTSFPWTPPITLTLATFIVFIPFWFRWAISRVSRPDPPEK